MKNCRLDKAELFLVSSVITSFLEKEDGVTSNIRRAGLVKLADLNLQIYDELLEVDTAKDKVWRRVYANKILAKHRKK